MGETAMILAGDIGATKTVLGLFPAAINTVGKPLHLARYLGREYDSLEAVIEQYLSKTDITPSSACFGVAGPIVDQRAQVTNLPWHISAASISAEFNIGKVQLINDLESIAEAVPNLESEDIFTLNPGVSKPHSTIAVVAPGTGLGTAFLVWTGSGYKALASEGGHTSFAPRNKVEIELLEYLKPRYPHVSFERICSGSHLPNLYEFLRDTGRYEAPAWLQTELEEAVDQTPVIVQTGLENKAEICVACLDMFVQILGSAISNMAITILPRGGIYLGGGIPPRILDRLRQSDFLEAVAHKGRFTELSKTFPIHVILTPNAPLYGAASVAARTMRTG